MSSPINNESRKFSSLPVFAISPTSTSVFNNSKISSRRHSSSSLVARNLVLILIVFIHEIHRLSTTKVAAFSNENDASRTNERRDLKAVGSNFTELGNSIDTGSKRIAIRTDATSDIFANLPFGRNKDRGTNDIDHEITKGLTNVTRANKILAYSTIIRGKDPRTFSARGNDVYLDEYLDDQFSRKKHLPRETMNNTTGIPEESDIFIRKEIPKHSGEKRIIFKESLTSPVASSHEAPLSEIGKKLNVTLDNLTGNYEDYSPRVTGNLLAKMTYKPSEATQPLERYDRRHFGPPRLENLEEFSKATTHVVPRSWPTVVSYTTFPYLRSSRASSIFTTSSSSSSASTQFTPLSDPSYGSAGNVLDDTRRVNQNHEFVAEHKENERHELGKSVGYDHDENRVKSEIIVREKFYYDNEDYVGRIDRFDEQKEREEGSQEVRRRFSRALTVPGDSSNLRQLSAAVSKVSSNESTPELETSTWLPPKNVTQIAKAAPNETHAGELHLTILGLFECTLGKNKTRLAGKSELQAARLAVDMINKEKVLSNIKLHLISYDTECDPGVAINRFFDAYHSYSKTTIMPFLLGTACSELTQKLAKIVPYWNMVQVSYGSTAPELSDQKEFPLFARTVPPDSSHNRARLSFVKYFGWDAVIVLSQSDDVYTLAANDLVTEFQKANITSTPTITFGKYDYKERLETLKESGRRIIIGSFSSNLARRLFCEASKLNMFNGDYAWIVSAEAVDLTEMPDDWKRNDTDGCSFLELSQALDGLIIVKSYSAGLTKAMTDTGFTTDEFTMELAKKGFKHSRFAGQTYDAVWSMALALQKYENIYNGTNLSIAHYNRTRKDIAEGLIKQLKNLTFRGVSGSVSFNGSDRVGITAFHQIHGHAVRIIALYTPENKNFTMDCMDCAKIRWPGEEPPMARRIFRFQTVTIERAAFIAVTCLSVLGVTLALSFLVFNFYFRKHKSIKLSSPRLNNVVALGCALVYGAVILLGLDQATLSDSEKNFPSLCTARAYMLSAGFTLAFGSIITKTYRVHRIFTKSLGGGVIKAKFLQDTQLLCLVFGIVLIDIFVVTLWITFDPMQRQFLNLKTEISSEDRGIIYQPRVEVCKSQNTNGWLAILYTYKGLLLMVGVCMAWKTRHVKIPALNDSQYIGLNVYLVVMTSVIVVLLANVMYDRATLVFVTTTGSILVSSTATLALLFLPQLAIMFGGQKADLIVHSLGLKIESNTRRFVTDDTMELQYRAQVQNSVYQRQLAQLELEVIRMEKQLCQKPIKPSRDSPSESVLPPRNPSISESLPPLLLSVLPPVIPRASWPSADPSGMRRGTVAFSSQPELEPEGGARRSLADIYKLQRRRDTEGPNRLGVFQRLISLFGSRPNSRKTSTASFTGVASALRVHMGYIAGLVPGTEASSTCQVNVQCTRQPHPRCGSGPIINITSEEERRLSLGLGGKESSEPRVNFDLPSQENASKSLSREKIRGSPRFPHKIVPANSLGALTQGSIGAAHQRWHSMDDGSRRKIINSNPHDFSNGPNDDSWSTRETGVRLSELLHTTRGRRSPENPALNPPDDDTNVSPNDAPLGNNLKKNFHENNTISCGHENDTASNDDSRRYSCDSYHSPIEPDPIYVTDGNDALDIG